MRTRQHLTIAVAAAITFAACSGSDDAAEDTTVVTEPEQTAAPDTSSTATPSTSTTVTTPQETSTTASTTTTTTSAPTTTAAPPATTTAPTTTMSADDANRQAVIEAVVDATQAYDYAVFNVGAPDALDQLRATHVEGGASLRAGLDNYQFLIDNGLQARPNPDIPEAVSVEGEIEFIDPDTAKLTLCEISAGVIFEPGSGPDGSDTIVDDQIVARRNRVTMVRVDGMWKLDSGTNLGKWTGEAACPPA